MKKLIWITSISIAFIFVIILFILMKPDSKDGCEQPSRLKNNHAMYQLDLCMNKDGSFDISADIKVENLSEQTWNEIPLYFIPNEFTKDNYPAKRAGEIKNLTVTVNNKKVIHYLSGDRLGIRLSPHLKPHESAVLKIDYHLKLPSSAYRIVASGKKYYLAQWYPMVPTYQDNHWNFQPYIPFGESYHTEHTSFQLHYRLQKGYILASSSEQDSNQMEGTLKADQIKEFYLAVLPKSTIIKSKKVNEKTTIRVLGSTKDSKIVEQALELGADAFTYYEKNIGRYPMKQLDILLTNKKNEGNMEYPGIVTVYVNSSFRKAPKEEIRSALSYPEAHEIGHQWFYGVVSNDPYHEAWLDEGLTELLTNLFFYSEDSGSAQFSGGSYYEKKLGIKKPSNLSLNYYAKQEYNNFIYTVPKAKLWELFQKNGGYQAGLDFLKAYYKTNAYKQVDSEAFVRFAMNYFHMKDDLFFRDWLLLRGYYDVPKDNPAYEAISELKETGFLNEDEAFHPDRPVSRYDAAVWLAIVAPGNPDGEPREWTASDLNSKDKNYPLIKRVWENGYFEEASEFHPEAPLTNRNFSYLLVNALKKGVLKVSKDGPEKDWLTRYVDFRSDLQPKIKQFKDTEEITREEYIMLIYKMWKQSIPG